MLAPSLIPHDIILADIRAVLYLDDLERDAAGVFELVLRCLRDEYGLALVEHGSLLAARDLGGAAQDDPVLRAVVVHLHRDGLAGQDADFLHPIANALADDRRRAPAVVHRRMLVRLLAAHPAEALDDRLHLLRRALPRDDDDIVRLDEQEIIEPDARDQAVMSHDQRIPAIEREHIALHRVAVRVVRQDIVHRIP